MITASLSAFSPILLMYDMVWLTPLTSIWSLSDMGRPLVISLSLGLDVTLSRHTEGDQQSFPSSLGTRPAPWLISSVPFTSLYDDCDSRLAER